MKPILKMSRVVALMLLALSLTGCALWPFGGSKETRSLPPVVSVDEPEEVQVQVVRVPSESRLFKDHRPLCPYDIAPRDCYEHVAECEASEVPKLEGYDLAVCVTASIDDWRKKQKAKQLSIFAPRQYRPRCSTFAVNGSDCDDMVRECITHGYKSREKIGFCAELKAEALWKKLKGKGS